MPTKFKIPRLEFHLMIALILFTAFNANPNRNPCKIFLLPFLHNMVLMIQLFAPLLFMNGDTIEAKILPGVYVWGKRTAAGRAEWTRLRNAVYVTYPYARRAGWVFKDIETHIANNPNKKQ